MGRIEPVRPPCLRFFLNTQTHNEIKKQNPLEYLAHLNLDQVFFQYQESLLPLFVLSAQNAYP